MRVLLTLGIFVVGVTIPAQQVATASQPDRITPKTPAKVTLTYLGTAGWQIADGSVVILLDPYFTRVPARTDTAAPARAGEPRPRIDPARPLVTDSAVIDAHIQRADFILVHHTHYDHVMDVPYIARKTAAIVIGTESAANVMRAFGIQSDKVIPVRGGEDYECGSFSIRVIPSLHGVQAEKHYVDRRVISPTISPPFTYDDFAEGGSLAYLIRIGGHQILTSGSANYIERELEGLRPDVVLVATLGREEIHDYTGRLMRVLGHPPLVLPTHRDYFLRPFDASQADYIGRVEAFVKEVLDVSPQSRVIVPRYFEPLTL